jgi:hypothetical protein
VQQGWVSGPDGASLPFWVDTAYQQEMTLKWVEFASEAYFALAQTPDMAEWLAVGQEMVIVVSDSEAVRVTMNAGEAARQSVSPVATPAPDVSMPSADDTSGQSSQNAWDAFWSWLWGN